MKKMLWQLPAVIGGTAVLTFAGVTVLQAAVNGPLQERGEIVMAERAIASQRAELAARATPTARVSAAGTTKPKAAQTATASSATPAPGAAGSSAPGAAPQARTPAAASDGTTTKGDKAAAPSAGRDTGLNAPHGAKQGPPDHSSANREQQRGPGQDQGRGVGAGRETAPGQNRDADGRPAKANGDPKRGSDKVQGLGLGAGRDTAPGQNRGTDGRPAHANSGQQADQPGNRGNGGTQAPGQGAGQAQQQPVLGPAGEVAREVMRSIDRLLGLPEPPGLSGPAAQNGRPNR
jgi:hypothetical protein